MVTHHQHQHQLHPRMTVNVLGQFHRLGRPTSKGELGIRLKLSSL